MPWLEKPGQGEGSGQEGKRCQTLCTCSRRKLRRWTFLASVPLPHSGFLLNTQQHTLE